MNQNEVISVNVEHVRSLLGDEHLRRLIERLRKRMSRGEALTGRIQLCGATPGERSAIDKLMGRLPTRGSSLTVDLDQLAQVMVRANACARLEEAVVAITGPVAARGRQPARLLDRVVNRRRTADRCRTAADPGRDRRAVIAARPLGRGQRREAQAGARTLASLGSRLRRRDRLHPRHAIAGRGGA